MIRFPVERLEIQENAYMEVVKRQKFESIVLI